MQNENIKEIYLAGGCFWGIEAYFDRINIPGIIETKVGYANGIIENPTYEDVSTGKTGFAETLYIKYNSSIASFDTILDHYFNIINPTILNRQGNDIGTQYRTGIFYTNDEELDIIQKRIEREALKYQNPIVVEVKKLENFYNAEEYHQKYLDKNPYGYCHIQLPPDNRE